MTLLTDNTPKKEMTPAQFQALVLTWAAEHGRHDLPWQQDTTPYAVLVSEIMLQQTQVITVIPYYRRWMSLFPDINTLAQANLDDVMQLWQGLGYYARAQNLVKAAQYICQTFNGIFPQTKEELLKIPGVGPYTTGAILSFAFNSYGPIVDGNVTRLFCRLFKIETAVGKTETTKQLWQLAEHYTPTKSRLFAQGLLDLGATLCTAKNPHCDQCPFNQASDFDGSALGLSVLCLSKQSDQVMRYPIPKIKKEIPTKIEYFKWCIKKKSDQNRLLLEKRVKKGIWANLWTLPLYSAPISTERADQLPVHIQFNHQFTHYKLDARLIKVPSQPLTANQKWVTIDELEGIALPTPMRTVIEKYFTLTNDD